MIFDTHAHYDDAAFDGDRSALLSALPEKGICGVLNCGASFSGCEKSTALSEEYGYIYAAVGIHPENVAEFTPEAFARVEELAKMPKCAAIGEIGLDYHWENFDKTAQKTAFDAQLRLAERLGLPVVIHSRDATGDVTDMLSGYCGTGVFHCFSGSVETAKILLSRGFYLGFGGALTFRNARRAAEAAAYAPPDRILLETDCPYMAPEPHRGSRCDSSMLPLVARKLAEIRGTARGNIEDVTRENAERLFGIRRSQ